MKYPFAPQRPEVYAPKSMTKHFLMALSLAAVVAGCAPHRASTVKHTSGPITTPVVHETTPFNKPLLSPGAQFGALPPPVQNTVIAEAGTEVIWDIVKEEHSGQTVYIIYFENQDIYPPLYVARDGSVLNPDYTIAVHAPEYKAAALGANATTTTVKLIDLPSKVLEVIHQQAGHSEVATIDKATWGNRIVYIVTFKDEKQYPKLYVEADGTLLKEGK
jgi:hypothetical protein